MYLTKFLHYSGPQNKEFGISVPNVILFLFSNTVKTTCDTEGTSAVRHKCVLCGNDFPTEECLKMHISLNHTETSDKCDGIVMVLNAEQPVSLLEKALKQIPG